MYIYIILLCTCLHIIYVYLYLYKYIIYIYVHVYYCICILDLIFVTPSVGKTCRGREGVGAMAASAACTALVSPYNIDLQPRNVAGVPGYAISGRVVQHDARHRRDDRQIIGGIFTLSLSYNSDGTYYSL